MWESESYLMHHGVKGQKWGVRRYQNEDGTLTDAGRRKYLTDGGGLTRAGVRRIKKELKRSEKLKIRQKMAEKNIRDINSGEAQKRYKEHSQSLVKAFGSKTINDVKQFDKKQFNRGVNKLGDAEQRVASIENTRRKYDDVSKRLNKSADKFEKKADKYEQRRGPNVKSVSLRESAKTARSSADKVQRDKERATAGPYRELKAKRDNQYRKLSKNSVARQKLENDYGYSKGVDTYYSERKRRR